jgi:hypothetical protein
MEGRRYRGIEKKRGEDGRFFQKNGKSDGDGLRSYYMTVLSF